MSNLVQTSPGSSHPSRLSRTEEELQNTREQTSQRQGDLSDLLLSLAGRLSPRAGMTAIPDSDQTLLHDLDCWRNLSAPQARPEAQTLTARLERQRARRMLRNLQCDRQLLQGVFLQPLSTAEFSTHRSSPSADV